MSMRMLRLSCRELQQLRAYRRQPVRRMRRRVVFGADGSAIVAILYAYERYGPGKLTAEEESRYWDECATAAELQTCNPADVPRTREGIRAYFDAMRPKLAGSEAAQSMMQHLLRAEVLLPPMPPLRRSIAWAASRILRAATIATMPRWMRPLGGLHQGRVTDAAVRLVIRPAFWLIDRDAADSVAMLGPVAPAS
jgi:uncharacterized protein (DUF2236 family)